MSRNCRAGEITDDEITLIDDYLKYEKTGVVKREIHYRVHHFGLPSTLKELGECPELTTPGS